MMEFSGERATAQLGLCFKYSEVGFGNWGEQTLQVLPSLSTSRCLLHPDITAMITRWHLPWKQGRYSLSLILGCDVVMPQNRKHNKWQEDEG